MFELKDIQPIFVKMAKENEEYGSLSKLVLDINRYMSNLGNIVMKHKVVVDMNEYIETGVEEFYVTLAYVTPPISTQFDQVSNENYLFVCNYKFKGRYE